MNRPTCCRVTRRCRPAPPRYAIGSEILSTIPRPRGLPPTVATMRACPRRRRQPRSRRIFAPGVRSRLSCPPENLREPCSIGDQNDERRHFQRESQGGWLNVVHPDVTHSDPGVPQDREAEEQGGDPERAVGEQRLPQRIVEAAVVKRDPQ